MCIVDTECERERVSNRDPLRDTFSVLRASNSLSWLREGSQVTEDGIMFLACVHLVQCLMIESVQVY